MEREERPKTESRILFWTRTEYVQPQQREFVGMRKEQGISIQCAQLSQSYFMTGKPFLYIK